MVLPRFLSRFLRNQSRANGKRRKSPNRTRPWPHLRLEPLEDRVLLSLIGLAQQSLVPDITSGASNTLSYTQLGGDANPFHYDSIPLTLTLGGSTPAPITNASDGTARRTELNVLLKDDGSVAAGGSAEDFRVFGHVTVGPDIFDGRLLTGKVREFGFSDTITPAAAEFEVRIGITGGALTARNVGPLRVGQEVGLLIHQPGLSITSFPQSFSFSGSVGASNARKLKERPTNTEPVAQPCGCTSDVPKGSGLGASRDRGGSVYLHNGASHEEATDLTIPGRGLDWQFTRTYRSDVQFSGPLGHNWDFNYDRHLLVVTPRNQDEVHFAFPNAKEGDVIRLDGYNRADIYVRMGDPDHPSFMAPNGFFTQLTFNMTDKTYTERDQSGMVITYDQADATGDARMTSMADRQGDKLRFHYDARGQLDQVIDTLNRSIDYTYSTDGLLLQVHDYNGRTLSFQYDTCGELVSETSPKVINTPNGNDFPDGKTTQYTYSAGFTDERLNHELLTVIAPNEVANGSLTPRVQHVYDTNPSSQFAGRVISQNLGGTNANGVPSGGTISYTYEIRQPPPPPNDFDTKAFQTMVTDRNGNQTQYDFNIQGNIIRTEVFTHQIRPHDAASFVTTFEYDRDYRLKRENLPEGNFIIYVYDEFNPDRFQQGNLLSVTRMPGPRGGDQTMIQTMFTYEPIYNQARKTVEPRGNDSMFVPPIDPPATAARYTTTSFFDYQESTEKAAMAPDTRLNMGGRPGRVNQSPLIAVDPNVLTTEVWLVQILGLPETAAGLLNTDPTMGPIGLRPRLSAAGVMLGLGDLNGDGDTTPAAQGNVIRVERPTVHLVAGSNEAAIEGSRLQPVVELYSYNPFGHMKRSVDPEGNVNQYKYYSVANPGSGSFGSDEGGYLAQTLQDTTSAPGRDSGTNPPPVNIQHRYFYDAVGNVTTEVDGRGIVTKYDVNQLNQVTQTTRAFTHDFYGADPTKEPLPLTDFRYLTRTFYDNNDNVVLTQVEDRGNTSNVAGPLPSADAPAVPGNFNPAGLAFASTIMKYDILDQRIEMVQEVKNGPTSADQLFLHTRYRYDPNGNLVLTIEPAGNATASVYDERDLLFQSIRGADTRPALGLYAAGDPTTFNRPGVDPMNPTPPSTFTFNYDLNANLIESVDAENNGGIHSMIAGVGDVTRTIYDGFDRPKTVIDPLGNQTVTTYDPASNVIRTTRIGEPVDDVLVGPHNHTLAVTEYIYDELSRTVATHQVLFRTPGTTPLRTPTLTVNPALATFAPYLADAASNPAAVPGRSDLTVLGRVTTLTEYDRDSRVVFTVDGALHVDQTEYDGVSRVIKTTDSALNNGFSGGTFHPGNLVGNTVETAYDANSSPIERKETDVTTVPGVTPEVFRTTSDYDSLNRLQITVDNRGQTMDYRYDSRDNLVAKADAVGPVTTRMLPRRGLGSTANVLVNDFGNVTQYTYDGINRLIETDTLLAVGGHGNGSYIGADLMGMKIAPPSGYLDTTQAGDGIITQYFAYDNNSHLLAQRDDNGNVTEYIYDNQNRTLVERKGINFTGTTFTVTGGDSGTFTPFLVGVPPVDTRPAPTDITYTYDRDSNIVTRVDEAGNNFACTYDALNRKKTCMINRAVGFIGTTQQTWTYDGLSRLTSVFDNNDPATTADDATTTDFYDSLSRTIEEQQRIGPLPPKAITFSYDIAASGSVDQLSALIYPDGRQLDSTYDNLNRLIGHTDHGQASAIGTYQYIGMNRVATLTYQNHTRLSYIGQVSGQNADVGYDDDRRIVRHRWEAFAPGTPLGSGTLVVGFGYQDAAANPAYDRADNRLIQEKLHDPGNSEVYQYRSDYELTSFARGTLNAAKTAIATPTTTPSALQSQTWNLDGTGNWVGNTHTTGGAAGTENRTHSNINELAEITGVPYGNNGTGTLQYDDNGNLLTSPVSGGVFIYQWDALNRLRKVSFQTGGVTTEVASYTYDAANRRVSKVVSNGGFDGTAPNGRTDFYYDDWTVVEEHDGTDAITQQYVYGNRPDEVWTLDNRRGGITVAQLNDGVGRERQFYYSDPLGSVFGLSDETGKLLVGYQYDAYGRPMAFAPGVDGMVHFGQNGTFKIALVAAANPYLYTGQRFDPETGLYYYKNRYYSTDLGRFISRDPVGHFGGSSGLYEYVQNAPTFFVDSSGWTLTVVDRPKGSNAAKETYENLKKLCPDGDLKMDPGGEITVGKKDFCKNIPKDCKTKWGCTCICTIVDSKYDWVIIPNVGTPGGPLWPHTVPSDQAGAYGTPNSKGTGSGGVVYTPTQSSKLEFGAYDPKGNARSASDVIILGHELCGHAYYMTQGLHDPNPQPRGNRPGHDQAIDMENNIRREQSGKEKLPDEELRGKFADPKKGESVWRKKGEKEWKESAPSRRDVE
jgi:RHS repeat-associated protein